MSRHKKNVLTLHRPKKIAHWGPKKPCTIPLGIVLQDLGRIGVE